MNYRITIDTALRRNPHKGCYIALEGIDGSGKSVQLEPLKKYFSEQGRAVTTVHFPRKETGLLATLNSKVLKGSTHIPKSAFQYLFSADYAMLVEETITPALQRGDVVITDRFHCWSSVPYGIWENSLSYDMRIARSIMIANGLLSTHHQFFIPDQTFYLSVSVKTAMERIAEKMEKEVYEKKEILENISKGYELLMKEFPEEFITIDAEKPIDAVTIDVIKVLTKKKL